MPLEANSLLLALYVLVILLLLVACAFFASVETALTSCTPSRIIERGKKGDARAATVLYLMDNYDKALTTVLIGNCAGGIAAASLSTLVFTALCGSAGVAYSTCVTTIIVIIFCEIIPKSLAKSHAEAYILWGAKYLLLMVRLFTPFTLLFGFLKKALKSFFKGKKSSSYTPKELLLLVDLIASHGCITAKSKDVLKAALEFDSLRASDILTPRVDIVGVEVQATNEEILDKFNHYGFSRMPVYEGSMDHIVGVVHMKDFYLAYIANPSFSLKAILLEPVMLHESTQISRALQTLQKMKTELAIIVDSYGGVQGMLSTEDIVEELVGDIWDEYDTKVTSFHVLTDSKLLVTASSNYNNLSVHDLFKYLSLDMDSYGVSNKPLSGWVVDSLGKLPAKGDSFTCRDLTITVEKTNLNRVLEIIVERKGHIAG